MRRTAEIFLFDADDIECMFAKYGINGIWDTLNEHGEISMSAEDKHQAIIEGLRTVTHNVPTWLEQLPLRDPNARPQTHRRMSNNSIAFEEKPSREMLHLIFTIMQNEGEPGFVNLEEAKRRRPNAEGLNPCAEILLDSYGVCNLTTVNVMAFVSDGKLDFQGLMQAQALSTRAGIRMTCLDLELPHWDAVHKRDRLIGTSLTGWKDAIGALEYDEDQEEYLLNCLQEVVRIESMKYCNALRIPLPLLDTTVKPEGTLSQVAGGVSSGLHVAHAPYFIRRIRINANDPLAKVAVELGWKIHAEIGTAGFYTQDELAKPDVIAQAKTLIVDFPMKSTAKLTRESQTVKSQMETYFKFQESYTAHNSSNTISVRPDEWEEVEEIIFDKWNEFVGVSFLSHDGGSYVLAPYEEITEEEYETLRAGMKAFDSELLKKYEGNELTEATLEGMDGCEGGACPVR